jgi:hypothetical protein
VHLSQSPRRPLGYQIKVLALKFSRGWRVALVQHGEQQ